MYQFSRHKKFLFFTISMLTILMMVADYMDICDERNLQYLNRERELLQVATRLNDELSSFQQILLEKQAYNLDEDTQTKTLNQTLQPIVMKIAEEHPGIGLGYYSRTLDRNVAIGPFFDPSFLRKVNAPGALQIYETGQFQSLRIEHSVIWGGKPILAVHLPIKRNGEIIGHTFANSKIEDIENAYFMGLAKRFLRMGFVWLVTIALVAFMYNRLKKAIIQVTKAIENENSPSSFSDDFPELRPILNTTIRLREFLRKQTDDYKTLLENCPFGIIRVSLDFRCLFVNPAWVRMFGIQTKDVIGNSWRECGFSEENYSKWEEEYKLALQTGQSVEFFTSYRAINGVTREFRICVISEKDADGQVTTFLVIVQDITEQKKSEELFVKSFNLNPNLMLLISPDEGIHIDVNEAYACAVGLQREAVIGTSVEEINLWVDLGQRDRIRKQLARKGKLLNEEIQYIFKPTQEVRQALLSVESINLGEKNCYLIVISDITDKKRLEEEIARFERLNIVGEMAAGIGHEVRNPMTTVRGYLQMFQRKNNFAQYHDQLYTMIEELDRANSIITEFLSLAKNKSFELKLGNLNGTIHALFPLIEAEGFRLGHNINTDIGDIPPICYDDKEIRQLILNLVRNGFEAMDKNGFLTIKTYFDDEEVVLEIQDTGTGIPEEVLSKIGTPFITTKERGTGLGLSVCYRVAERHGAKIMVKSSTEGTTFSVKFPVPENL